MSRKCDRGQNNGGVKVTTTKVKTGKADVRGGEGGEDKKEIEGFHLPTASLCLSAQQVIKEPANRVP